MTVVRHDDSSEKPVERSVAGTDMREDGQSLRHRQFAFGHAKRDEVRSAVHRPVREAAPRFEYDSVWVGRHGCFPIVRLDEYISPRQAGIPAPPNPEMQQSTSRRQNL